MKRVETREHVQGFLDAFYSKLSIWGIVFINRVKNDEALTYLGITAVQREQIINEIGIEDYIETITDDKTFGEMWVFGKEFSEEELYIKVSLGRPNNNTICISFHKSEFKNKYVFKKSE